MSNEQNSGRLQVGSEPTAYANRDELDNMLDDRTATVAGVRDGWRNTPLYVIPEGYVLVPIEPTPEMLEHTWDKAAVRPHDARDAWKVMLRHAPKPSNDRA